MPPHMVTSVVEGDLSRKVEDLKGELTEARQQQTATAEILRVIRRSPTDVQPVFDTIVASAVRLLRGNASSLSRIEGNQIALAAMTSTDAAGDAAQRQRFPLLLDSQEDHAQVTRTGAPLNIADAYVDPRLPDAQRASARIRGYRSLAVVPLLVDKEVVGALGVSRSEAGGFTDDEIAILRTFADQALIAIENTRLFEEVQARTHELQQSLEYQTATGEVLNVISRSPTDVQPVFDMIAESAWRLCEAQYCFVYQFDGQLLHFVAHHGLTPEVLKMNRSAYPTPPGRKSAAARAVLERRVVQIPDVKEDSDFALGPMASVGGFGSVVGVPILRDGVPVGSIAVTRVQTGLMPERQIGLLKIFADQAVIAIENTRLFEEVQARTHELQQSLEYQTATGEVLNVISRSRELARSVEELRALGDVSQAVNSTLELETVLSTIVAKAVQLSTTDAGTIYVFEEASQEFQLRASYGMDQSLVDAVKGHHLRLGDTVISQAALQRKPVQLPDVQRDSSLVLDVILRAGFRALLAIPLLSEGQIIGSLVVRRKEPGEFSARTVDLLQTFGAQSVLAIQNARLFEEIARKSRELEIASQHKSQFVANMSHELRTPLAAILGYAELMQEGFYEPQGAKSLDALTRIRSNGKHLLGLINTVLDIAKIESGQFTLNMAEYAIESVVETVRSATESLAQNKKLSLKTELAKSLPIGLGDEQRLTQVLLNLVGNAIKFTDRGEVRVTAEAVNGRFHVSVTDTGPGIPDHERTRIFEQFHQVDSSLTKAAGGTGLGLAIAKQIVEMHGGRIWVESTVGKGSTFQMEIPTRAEFRKRTL
jgi:signal transduction histidine kinase